MVLCGIKYKLSRYIEGIADKRTMLLWIKNKIDIKGNQYVY